ncbi:MAG: lycopene cyclase domain-containing protein, partial [Anaerolineae bacterium]|nr:lycopene cyclase domain-containing protein [Anaerolineae bacterium]
MTYLNFLILFVLLPTLLMVTLFRQYLNQQWAKCVGALSLVAVIWTTPWDNYLVASGVWDYDRDLVLNIIIGYVPIEEYAFFVLQTLMTSVLFAGVLAYTPA